MNMGDMGGMTGLMKVASKNGVVGAKVLLAMRADLE